MKIKSSGSEYTQQVSYFKAKWQHFNDKEYKWKNRDSAFSNIVVKFSTMAVVNLQEGFKLTGRYGDKGIISRIEECGGAAENLFNDTIDSILDIGNSNGSELSPEDREKLSSHVAIVDDCEMPYLDDGTQVDILLNSSGAIRRQTHRVKPSLNLVNCLETLVRSLVLVFHLYSNNPMNRDNQQPRFIILNIINKVHRLSKT